MNNFIIEGAHSNYDPDVTSFSLQSWFSQCSMSEPGSDQEIVTETAQWKSSSRANDGTELSTDGDVSLFSTVLTNALEQQKINILQHFESCFAKNEKQTGVEAGDFVFKHEGNRIQLSFNTKRADKLAKLESLIKIKDLTAASKLKLFKIGWNVLRIY